MNIIEVKGVDKVLKRLEKLSDTKTIKQSMGKACAVVEAAAKQNAPKDTGALRNSITSKVENRNGHIEGTIFTPLEYAPYVEYGTGLFAESGGRKDVPWNYQDDKGEWHSTSGQKPHPFMRPAIEDNRNKIIEILKEGVRND